MTRSTTSRFARRDKRGTVLIFAVGALAVIAIVAVSYVSVVRIERNSAAAVTSQSNLGESIDIVSNEIKAVLAADLFGNKVVTPSTPEFLGAGNDAIRVRPRMFEDMEFSDYPMVDALDTALNQPPDPATRYRFDPRFFGNPNSPPSISMIGDEWVLEEDSAVMTLDGTTGIGRRFETAPADDAWLATTEPEYHDPAITEATINPQVVWRNITNLRSAYHWVDRERNQGVQLWVRDHGRFADLAEFFNTGTNLANDVAPPSNMFGDAGRNINIVDPEFGSVAHANGAALNAQMLAGTPNPGLRTAVYDYQMAYMAENLVGTPGFRAASSGSIVPRVLVTPMSGDGEYDGLDERWWVDTDGDLRPDARWQQFDSLGSLGNLVWVVGTRIIDASSLVNVNSSIAFDGFGSGLAENQIAFGHTPADIDLFRLLRRAEDGSSYYSNDLVDVSRLGQAFRRSHVSEGLGLTEFGRPATVLSVFQEIADPALGFMGMPDALALPYIDDVNGDLGADYSVQVPNRTLRSAYYDFVGNAPQENDLEGDISYPMRDIYDLMAFWGTNHGSVVSKVEQRLDGPDSNPLYPRSLADYSTFDAGPFGPLLSLRDPAMQRAYDAANPEPGITDMRNSVRNSITTISGVAKFSPVPVLNNSDEFRALQFREKINLRELAAASNNRNGDGRSSITGDSVRPVFEALTWALAPFATDQPYTSELAAAQQNLFSMANLGNTSNFHYGGGSNVPGSWLAELLFVDPQNLSPYAQDPGPSVALMTAASLTANLIDAMDSDANPTDGINFDFPTVLRVLPRMNRLNGQREIADNTNSLPIELGLNMAHGEVNLFHDRARPQITDFFGDDIMDANADVFVNTTDAIAAENQIVDSGLTVVGLEAQPFITDAISMAFYTDATVDSAGADGNGFIAASSEQLGSFFAVKLFNPWPQSIEIDDSFQIVIPTEPTGSSRPQLSIESFPDDSLDLRFILPNRTIGARQELVLYWSLGIDAAPWNAQLNGSTVGQAIEPAIIEAIQNDSGIETVPFAGGPTGDPMATVLRTPVMFQRIVADTLPVLLVRGLTQNTNDTTQTVFSTSDSNGTPMRWVVLDRLRSNSGDAFPAVLPDGSNIPLHLLNGSPVFNDDDLFRTGFDPTDPMETRDDMLQFSGRLMVMSSLSRPKERGSNGGWPTGVIERPSDNLLTIFDPSGTLSNASGLADAMERSYFAQIWLEPTLGGDPAPALHPRESPVLYFFQDLNSANPPSVLANGIGSADPHVLDENSIDSAATVPTVPNFQLYVPDRPLNTVAEIGQLSIFAHTCSGHNLTLLENWITASEKMGLAMSMQRSGLADPYFGTLDPSRYLFNGGSNDGDLENILPAANGFILPENLTVPLATRVYDCFEALSTLADLKQGVINVNTASARVLEMLPFIKPAQTYMAPDGTSLPTGVGAASTRANMIVEYRDRVQSPEVESNQRPNTLGAPDFTQVGNFDANGLGLGLRNSRNMGTGPDNGGITAIGELSLLDAWTASSGQITPGTNGFGHFGSNTINDGAGVGAFLPLGGNFLDPTPGTNGIDPIDDPEERNRIFSAVSNMVTTRSDVFLAWTVIRGYDPDEIERISIPAGNPEQALLELEPAFDRRYLLVLDRSNVREPTDRPRVLLRFRLPDVN